MGMFRDLSKKWWLWVIGGAGVLLLAIGSISNPQSAPAKSSIAVPKTSQGTVPQSSDYGQILEVELQSMLSQLPTVENPKVMITLDSTEQTVFAQNKQTTNQNQKETDTSGGTRLTTNSTINDQVVLKHSGSNDLPVVEKQLTPKVRGVLVMAKGADDPRIQEEIVIAVSSLLDVPAYKVSVLPEK